MRRLAPLFAFALAACGSDPIVGRWAGGREPIVFHDDGRAELPVNSIETSCEEATDVIAECARHQRWQRRGDHYRLTFAAISRRRSATGFEAPGPCRCGSEHVDVEVHGDELIVTGTDKRLRRVR